MRKLLILIALFAVAAVVAASAFAGGPYTHAEASGTGSDFIALTDSLGLYPVDVAISFADEDVTVSYWDYTTANGWVRVNNDGGPPENVGSGDANADSVSTIPAGTIERPDFSFKAIYLTRSAATAGVIKWFK